MCWGRFRSGTELFDSHEQATRGVTNPNCRTQQNPSEGMSLLTVFVLCRFSVLIFSLVNNRTPR